MLNLNKHTKTKPKPTLIFKNCSYMCVYHCAQLLCTIQHRIVLITFSLTLHTIIKAQMTSTGGRGMLPSEQFTDIIYIWTDQNKIYNMVTLHHMNIEQYHRPITWNQNMFNAVSLLHSVPYDWQVISQNIVRFVFSHFYITLNVVYYYNIFTTNCTSTVKV